MTQYQSLLHQNAKVDEELYLNGELAATSGYTHEVIGEVEILYKSKHGGKTVFTRTINRNDLLVTGAVFLSEKVNQIRSSYYPTPLDVAHDVHTADTRFSFDSSSYLMKDVGVIPYERICGIMIGRGGCGETYNQVHRVYRTDTEVPEIVPFRTICLSDGEEDLTGDERKLYFMRSLQTINGKDCVCYYGKRFQADREINVQWEDGTVVNVNALVPGNDRGKLVKTFTKFTTSISVKDVREYCRLAEGSTVRSLVNSIGLMSGFPVNPDDNSIITPVTEALYENPYEFANIRGMTTLNTDDYPFKDRESTMDITYRLYFV